jgi:hypothetical protein
MRTFTAVASAVAMPTSAAAKTLFKIYNTHATMKLNVTRVWLQNTGVAVVTGVFQTVSLGRFTTDQASGTAIVPIQHDTLALTNALSVTCATATSTSVTLVDTFRQIIWSGDEMINSASKVENLLAMPQFSILWDSGYGDTNIEPIVLNTNEGLAVTAAGVSSGVGTVDVYCEFWSSLA